jgi:hypothetical protein
VSAAAAAFLCLHGGPAAAAELAPAGAKAVLTVEYVYQSEGTRSQPEQSSRWKRRRATSLTVELAAAPASAAPILHVMDAEQQADLERRARAGEELARQTAPAAANAQQAMEAAMARCGDDEDCLVAEMMKLNDPSLAEAGRAGAAAGAGLVPSAARYQHWTAQKQSGSFQVDETEHREVADMSCPASRCLSEATRTGKGSAPGAKAAGVPAAGIGAAEVDAQGATLALRLPVPLGPLPVTKVVTSNASGAGSPAGTFEEQLYFAPDVANEAVRLVVPLAGDWRSQSGEKVVKLGAGSEAGTLTARWRFSAR